MALAASLPAERAPHVTSDGAVGNVPGQSQTAPSGVGGGGGDGCWGVGGVSITVHQLQRHVYSPATGSRARDALPVYF